MSALAVQFISPALARPKRLCDSLAFPTCNVIPMYEACANLRSRTLASVRLRPSHSVAPVFQTYGCAGLTRTMATCQQGHAPACTVSVRHEAGTFTADTPEGSICLRLLLATDLRAWRGWVRSETKTGPWTALQLKRVESSPLLL